MTPKAAAKKFATEIIDTFNYISNMNGISLEDSGEVMVWG